MKKDLKNLDAIIERVLILLEKGKTISEIEVLFAKEKKEIASILKTIDFLVRQNKILEPPVGIAARILNQIRLKANQDKKATLGRASLFNFLNNQIQTLMGLPFKVIIPVLLVLFIGVMFGVTRFSDKKVQDKVVLENQQTAVSEETTVSAPETEKSIVGSVQTSSQAEQANEVDVITSSILEDTQSDVLKLEEVDNEVDFVKYDSKEVDDFGQSINENDY